MLNGGNKLEEIQEAPSPTDYGVPILSVGRLQRKVLHQYAYTQTERLFLSLFTKLYNIFKYVFVLLLFDSLICSV